VAKNKVEEGMTHEDLTLILSLALSQVMGWMPEENRSKAIVLEDPRDPKNLCAVHTGPDGITLLMGDGFKGFCEELLCEECIAKLEPYSVIFTGFNLETGEFDPEAFVGLYGSHDEDIGTLEVDLDDEEIEIQPSDMSRKRTLN
jgi:hypothetical protein